LTQRLAFGPYRFALTEEEARVATARLALRYGLSRRFERDYVAPLVLFVLLLIFVTVLAFSGLISRRLAEAALLIGAVIFLATRFSAHWRLHRAQRVAKGVVDGITAAGETSFTVDENGLAFGCLGGRPARRDAFSDFAEADDAGGVIYLWRLNKKSAPIVIPTRIFTDATEVEKFLAFVRARLSKR
jgi:hypothetical protein